MCKSESASGQHEVGSGEGSYLSSSDLGPISNVGNSPRRPNDGMDRYLVGMNEETTGGRGRRLQREEEDLFAPISPNPPFSPSNPSLPPSHGFDHPPHGSSDHPRSNSSNKNMNERHESSKLGNSGLSPSLDRGDSFIQTIRRKDPRGHLNRLRSASPVRLESQFGAPKVKNLPKVVNKRKRSICEMILMYLHQMIPPVFTWAPKYQLSWFMDDAIAGFSSGVYGIPQAMALGVLAGLTPVDGLYTALAPAVVYILLGPSRSMSMGPASVIALLVGNAVATASNPTLMAFSLNFFMGVIFMGLGLLRVGFLATVISMPIVVGFTMAAAFLVNTTQVKYMLGLKTKSNSTIIDFFQIMIPAIKEGPVNGWAVLISLACLFFLISLRFHPKLKLIPGPVIVSIVCILITYIFRLDKHAGIAIVGDIPSGLPTPLLPFAPAKDLSTMVGSLIVISAISLVEIVSISKTFAVKAGTIINTNTELIACGASAIIGSFFRSFPVSASFSKTALNDSAGAKSQFSNVVRHKEN